MTAPAQLDRTEILHQLEVQHERLLAELSDLDQRIDAALNNIRGDGVRGDGASRDGAANSTAG